MSNLDTCGCARCNGRDGKTPQPDLYNPPGQPALNYRISVHSQFLKRMLSQISGTELPDGDHQGERPLAALTTRAEDDFSIGLMDGWAVVGDVLSFYQERIVNEGYLRTATERFSVLQLARAIGYELGAGVSAETYLAFTLDESDSTPQSAVIAAGTQVQSLPQKQNELPQTFETAADFTAHVGWNTLYPQQNKIQSISSSTTTIYFEGVNTGLKKGHLLLFEKGTAVNASVVSKVEAIPADDRTLVTLQTSAGISNPDTVYAMREQVSPFGYNATHFNMVAVPKGSTNPYEDWDNCAGIGGLKLAVAVETADDSIIALEAAAPIISEEVELNLEKIGGSCGWEIWKSSLLDEGYFKNSDIYLERVVEGILPGSLIALHLAPDTYAFYRVREVETAALTEFNLSGKSSGLSLNSVSDKELEDKAADKPGKFKVRKTTIYANSEALKLANVPVETGIASGDVSIIVDGEIDTLLSGQSLLISGEDLNGSDVSERVTLESAVVGTDATTLTFSGGLVNSYTLETAVLYGNVVHATHGETVADEALGGGDGATPHQQFMLRKPPLTHASAETPSGSKAELTLRINGAAWQQASTLYDLAPDAKSFIVRLDNQANARLIFGDGKMGARLPTGQENVRATYRSGTGLDGEVSAGTLTLLKKRPFGVSSVSNPMAAGGAADPETLDKVQTNAPLTVKTLDRIVSVQDYEDFARAFAGIGKAAAVALWDGSQELVHVTVADPSGGTVPDDQIGKLRTAMDAARDPKRELCIGGFQGITFSLSAGVLVDEAYVRADVEAAVTTALQTAYAFSQRAFGQPVSSAEIITAIQSVPGIIAVDLDTLYFDGQAGSLNSLLAARMAQFNQDLAAATCGAVQPAQLLLINPNGITLKEMAP